MLEARNIDIDYGTGLILEEVQFAVRAGEFVAVIGANGAGKTSLLRALNGTVETARGEVLLEGKELGSYSRAQISKKIAVVAQENETKFPMTVREFVLAGRFAHGGPFGWETEDDLRIADRCLELCRLEGFSDRIMNELSGGERQRVLLSRAFATEAGILLLDEPTNNLDLSNQALILKLVKKRCETCGSSALVITHDLNLAAEFADRALMLKSGRIVADGAPEDVLTESNISKVFNMNVLRDRNPRSGRVRLTPLF